MTPSATLLNVQPDGKRKSFEKDVLARIQHLDISKDIIDKSSTATDYGGFSEVFRGQLRRDGLGVVDIAIKRLRFHVDEEKVKKASTLFAFLRSNRRLIRNIQQFAQEVYVWSKLSHPNVLPLLGYAVCEETCFPLLISEWMHLGTAWSYVRENQDMTLSDVAVLVCFVGITITVLLADKDRYGMLQQA